MGQLCPQLAPRLGPVTLFLEVSAASHPALEVSDWAPDHHWPAEGAPAPFLVT